MVEPVGVVTLFELLGVSCVLELAWGVLPDVEVPVGVVTLLELEGVPWVFAFPCGVFNPLGVVLLLELLGVSCVLVLPRVVLPDVEDEVVGVLPLLEVVGVS